MTRLHAELVLNNYFLLAVRATHSYNITDSVALLSLSQYQCIYECSVVRNESHDVMTLTIFLLLC